VKIVGKQQLSLNNNEKQRSIIEKKVIQWESMQSS
jgi:hypothetical protein